MLIFHEGLPGSGKSYEAMVRHVVPAVQKGRQVIAHVNGIDHDRIAEVAAVPVDQVRDLVKEISADQVLEIWKHVPDNALVLIDELQNYYPTTRTKPGPEITKFVAENRHHGLDIIYMGQSIKDCHALWRRRTDRKIQFETRDVVGKPQDYTWRAFKMRDPASEKWELIQSGKGTYEPAMFGMYKSVVSDAISTERLGEDRILIWKRPAVKYGIPAVLALMGLGIGAMVWFFTGGAMPEVKQAKTTAPASTQAAPAHPAQAPAATPQAPPPVAHEDGPMDPFDEVLRAGRPRLSGVIRSMDGKRFDGFVEVIDKDQDIVRERFRLSWAQDLGWAVLFHSWGVTVMKGTKHVMISTWPRDDSKRGLDSTTNSGLHAGPVPNSPQANSPPDPASGNEPPGGVSIPAGIIGPGKSSVMS